MVKIKFEVIIEIDENEPVDEQLNDCYISDDEDEQLFEDVTDKKFSELTKEQQEWAATWKFKDDMEDGVADEDYDFKFIGVIEAEKKKPAKKPVTKKVKADDSDSG